MTRNDALRRVRAVFESSATERQMADFVDALLILDVIEFDEPKDELYTALRDLMVEIEYRPFQGSAKESGERTGRLSAYGAGCVISFLEQRGFKIEKVL